MLIRASERASPRLTRRQPDSRTEGLRRSEARMSHQIRSNPFRDPGRQENSVRTGAPPALGSDWKGGIADSPFDTLECSLHGRLAQAESIQARPRCGGKKKSRRRNSLANEGQRRWLPTCYMLYSIASDHLSSSGRAVRYPAFDDELCRSSDSTRRMGKLALGSIAAVMVWAGKE